MRKYSKIVLTGLILTLSMTSCLDKLPDDAIPENEAINTVSDANQAVIGIYAKFKSSALYSGYLTLLPDLQSDLVQAVEGYTNTYGDTWRWEVKATNDEVEAVYGELYGVIGRCNFLLENMDKVESNTYDETDLNKLVLYNGEAHFARALAYAELIKMYCKAYDPATADNEQGVALVTSYSNPGKLTRASLKASYQRVLDDLKVAEECLAIDDDDTQTLYNSTYFTIGAVNALYARVYLYMQDWENAVKYSTKVIESGKYLLSSATTQYSNSGYSYYDYMWNYDSSTEIIWKVGFEITSYGGALGRIFQNYDYISYKPDYIPANWVLNLYSNTDLRYDSFFKSVATGYTHGLTCPILMKYPGNLNFQVQNILHVNMPKVFRLSEQYLIRAEAYCQQGNYSKAGSDISTLRKARYSTYGNATAITESTWLDIIGEERVKELYMEGFRLQDLKRWHKGFERKAQTNTIAPGNALKILADDKRFVWPIPQHELESPDADIQPNESN